MAQKTLEELFFATDDTDFDKEFWNRFMRELGTRFASLDTVKVAWDEVSKQGVQVALDRINEALGPAAERIQNIASLGFLSVAATNEASLALGVVTFNMAPGPQRDLFVPTPFVAVTRAADPLDYGIGTVIYFNRETGVMDVQIQYVEGDPGPFSDWTISAVAGQAIAQTSILNAAKQVKTETDQIRTATDQIRTDTNTLKNETADLRTETVNARNTTVAVAGRYHGASATPPETEILGNQYLDTSVTPNVVKVLTESGWAPTVTVSVGGTRSVDYPVATGTEGTGPFAVGGGFTFGDVFLNGVKLRSGDGGDVTLSPGETGTFTLSTALVAGDELAFRGYLANDVVDIYTKSEADGRFFRRDAGASYTEAEKGRARANIGGGILAGFRNKLINPGFSIWQRGQSFTVAAGETKYVADRWLIANGTNQSLAITIAPYGLAINDANNAMAITFDTAPTTGQVSIAQRIESVLTLAGRLASHRCRMGGPGVATGNVDFAVTQAFGTGGSANVETAGTLTLANAEAKGTVLVPPTSGKVLGSAGDFLQARWRITPRATGVYTFGKASLVEGDATAEDDPFSPRHIQQELALCKRYCQVLRSNVSFTVFVTGWAISSNSGRVLITLPVEMRASPTAQVSSASHFIIANKSGSAGNVTAFAYWTDPQRIMIDATVAGTPLVGGEGVSIQNSDIDGRFILDAEI